LAAERFLSASPSAPSFFMIPMRYRAQVVIGLLCGVVLPGALVAQALSPRERAEVEAWFGRTVERTPGGEWGVVIGAMDGRVLWSANPELELIPASTTKLFTTGFARARMGGGARITTRVVGDGRVDSATGRWQGSWALELGGDPTLDRAGRAGPTLRELARRLRERGGRELEGPLTLTSRTGPAFSSYPTVWSADFEGQLYAPPIGPVTLHENTVSLTFRPGREVGSPPSLVSAYPDGAERMVRIAARTVDGSRSPVAPGRPDGGWTLSARWARSGPGLSAVAHDPAAPGGAWAPRWTGRHPLGGPRRPEPRRPAWCWRRSNRLRDSVRWISIAQRQHRRRAAAAVGGGEPDQRPRSPHPARSPGGGPGREGESGGRQRAQRLQPGESAHPDAVPGAAAPDST
jgi:hypothetical protein